MSAVSKPGKYGTLYLYLLRYKDKHDPMSPEFTWKTWAYDSNHAVDRFYESDDDGWAVLSWERASDSPGSQHRVPKHQVHEMDEGRQPKAKKLPNEMTAAQINHELEGISIKLANLNDDFIDAGRGYERPSETRTKTDPLSLEWVAVQNRLLDLRHEMERRMGPEAKKYSSLPKHFGPIFGGTARRSGMREADGDRIMMDRHGFELVKLPSSDDVDLYEYGPANIEVEGSGRLWHATIRFEHSEKTIEAHSSEEAIEQAKEYVDTLPEISGYSDPHSKAERIKRARGRLQENEMNERLSAPAPGQSGGAQLEGAVRHYGGRFRYEGGPRHGRQWRAFVSVWGHDLFGEGETKTEALTHALRNLPSNLRRHFDNIETGVQEWQPGGARIMMAPRRKEPKAGTIAGPFKSQQGSAAAQKRIAEWLQRTGAERGYIAFVLFAPGNYEAMPDPHDPAIFRANYEAVEYARDMARRYWGPDIRMFVRTTDGHDVWSSANDVTSHAKPSAEMDEPHRVHENNERRDGNLRRFRVEQRNIRTGNWQFIGPVYTSYVAAGQFAHELTIDEDRRNGASTDLRFAVVEIDASGADIDASGADIE